MVPAKGQRVASYRLHRRIGSGGMGEVWAATDLPTGRRVALKFVVGGLALTPELRERSFREARAAARVRHPAVIEVLDAFMVDDEVPVIAMELLRGETLARRLGREGTLALREMADIMAWVVSAVGEAHAAGIVHRDLKPDNVFVLDEGAGVKVLDFGIAKIATPDESGTLTSAGRILGTPAYMAPEQCRAAAGVDHRADIWAIGVMIYELLSGARPIRGRTVGEVVEQLILVGVPPLRALVPDAPFDLAIVARKMLERDPEARPSDLREVAEVLARHASVKAPAFGAPRSRPADVDIAPLQQPVETLMSDEQRLVCFIVVDQRQPAGDWSAIEDVAARFGVEGSVDGGTWLACFPPGDYAIDAARCALALADVDEVAAVALTTARGLPGAVPLRPAVDRARALMRSSARGAHIDEVTAALLPARFEVEGGLLVAERAASPPRRLTGKATPCVGRDKELAMLSATWRECLDDEVARAVVVLGPAGIGKSRLASELSARLEAEGRVLFARADPMSSRSPLALVRALLRAAGRVDNEFLAELLGDRVVAPSEQLEAARREPALMREHKRRAFLDWLGGQLHDGPILCIIEDLHWGDAASVGYLDEALREHGDRPWMVLALARSEVRDLLQRAWRGRQEVTLGPLTRRASERLARVVLEEAPESTIRGVVERADGNAFYLEELIRCAANGRDDDLPASVLAMVERRLDRLTTTARRTLRAASIFGETFRRAAVEALSGSADIDALVAEELVDATADGELRFRHALVRDAAYATVMDDERPRAHRLAAEWLERTGDVDALRLAAHWERAGEAARAIPYLLRASRASLEGGDLDGAIAVAERGLVLGAQGTTRGLLHLVQAEAHGFKEEWSALRRMGGEARRLVREGSPEWWVAAAAVLLGEQQQDDWNAATESALVITQSAASASTTAEAWALSVIAAGSALVGHEPLARAALSRLPARADAELGYRGLRSRAEFYLEYGFGARLDCLQTHAGAFRDAATALGHPLWTVLGFNDRGVARLEIGDGTRALRDFERAVALARDHGANWLASYAAVEQAIAALSLGEADEVVEAAVAGIRASKTRAMQARADAIDACLRLRSGDLAEAEALLAHAEPMSLFAVPVLAEIDLARGDGDRALARVERVLPTAPVFRKARRATLLVLRARALWALGRADEAHSAITAARDHVLTVASTTNDPAWRDGYLANVAPAAETLSLARDWLGSG